MVHLKRGAIVGGIFIVVGLFMWFFTDTTSLSGALWAILVIIVGVIIILKTIGTKLREWIGLKD